MVIMSDDGYPCQYVGPELAKTNENEDIKRKMIILNIFFIMTPLLL
ncbi:hypothetical protein SDC9_178834 [bioreactor metagenome]|uniref:Uncharacterized protein n=1 Tax=bioreactor metagenome TaxID=1076179 RepID=A0A645GY89_9ZZZZ